MAKYALSNFWNQKVSDYLMNELQDRAKPENGEEYKVWMCIICGWMYEEDKGCPEEGLAPGTRWDDVPEDWSCPDCGASKEDFEMIEI